MTKRNCTLASLELQDRRGSSNDKRWRHEGCETASMSTAHEEADDGPVYDDSEEELQNNVDTQNTKDGSGHEHITQQAGQPRGPAEEEEEEEEGDMSVGDHIPSKNGIYIGDERLRSPIVSRDSTPEIGRPSSADGSLSIPDDTPSIQVSNGMCYP